MNKREKKFYGKILMFGEYVLMFDSMALSIPYKQKYGCLTFSPGGRGHQIFNFTEHLKPYLNHLKELQAKQELLSILRLDEMQRDIKEGLVFDSTLPIGYGLGSSGALVAALYDRYAEDAIVPAMDLTVKELLILKKQFSQLESFFHGTSSGLDPLVSYLHEAILIEGKDKLKTVSLPEEKEGRESAIFLLDTGVMGETQPLVNWFMEQCEENHFCNRVKNEFIPLTNDSIRSFLAGNTDNLLKQVKQLSRFTLSHFHPMVPEHLNAVWEKGLASDAYYLKLCGSGGGGMMLGFTKDMEKAREMLGEFPIDVIRFL